jgi:hypothetical protein
MKNLNAIPAESFTKFEKIPASALTEITPNPGENLLSDKEIFETGEHAQSSFIPNTSEGPNPPNDLPAPNVAPGTKLGNTVSGKFITDMADLIIPSLAVFLIGAIGYGIDKKTLGLSAKEKETLTPLVQAYLDSINVNFNNPLNNLLFGLAMVYGSKIVDVIPTAEKLQKAGKPNAKPSTVAKVVDLIKQQKTTDEILVEIGKKRKKGIKDAIQYFNENKKTFGKENEPDIKLPS